MPGLARSLHEMMNQHVLPHAQRDTMANLRGLMAKQRELRHVVYMCIATDRSRVRVRFGLRPKIRLIGLNSGTGLVSCPSDHPSLLG